VIVKTRDAKKDVKKKPAKSILEKRKDKQAKKINERAGQYSRAVLTGQDARLCAVTAVRSGPR
jgi:hypothetical protein